MWTLEDALLVIGELTMEKRILEHELIKTQGKLKRLEEERAEVDGEVSNIAQGS